MKKFLVKILSVLCLSLGVIPSVQGREISEKTGVDGMSRFGMVRQAPPEGLSISRPVAILPDKISKEVSDVNYPEMIGTVVYSTKWLNSEPEYGIYEIPMSSGVRFEKIFPLDVYANYGAAVKDGVYYFNYYNTILGISNTFESYGVNLDTGEVVYYHNNASAPLMAPGGMDTDPITGEIYGIFYNSSLSGLELATIKYGDGAPKKDPIVQLSDWYVGFVIASDGTFYVIQQDSKTKEGILGTMDRNTGEFTRIGNTGQKPAYLTDACIDRRTNRIFWALAPSDGSGYLVELDTETGASTVVVVYENDEEVAGLWVPEIIAEPKSPDFCTDLAVKFVNNSLAGKLTFTSPEKCFDGTSLSGPMDVTVQINGVDKMKMENISAGETRTLDISVDTPGKYTFAVYASNSAGDGPKASVKRVWVGDDIPETTSAEASFENGMMTVTWKPVTESVNGGYLNIDNLSYTVKDKENNIIASNLKSTEYSFQMDVPEQLTTFYYMVQAVCEGNVSEPARTNGVTLGSIIPPYTSDFLEQGLDGWTIFDENGDGRTWTLQTDGSMRILFNSSIDMDDWLITPPVKLEAGKSYVVSFIAACGSDIVETLEVKYGDKNSPASMTGTLMPPTEINVRNTQGGKEYSEIIVPSESGNYYIGFHGISPADQYRLYLKDISIKEGATTRTPGQVSNLTVIPGERGALNATVSFNAPDTDLVGKPLAELTSIELYRGEELIHTFSKPDMGAEYSYADSLTESREVTYTVIGYNGYGAGQKATVSTYVGYGVPVAPTDVRIARTDTEGMVSLSWKGVTQDIGGRELPDGAVTYTVCKYENEWKPLNEDITETECQYQVVEPGKQEMVQLAVFAKTMSGMSTGAVSELIPVGSPYDGLEENFADGKLHYVWAYSPYGDCTLRLATDQTFQDIKSVDGDNGFLAVNGKKAGDACDFISGLISLQDKQDVTLSFYTYNIGSDNTDNNTVTISALNDDSDEWVEIMPKTEIYKLSNGKEGWNQVTVPADALSGKVVRLKFMVETAYYAYTVLDNIAINGKETSSISNTEINDSVEIFVRNGDIVVMNAESQTITVSVSNGMVLHTIEGKDETSVTVAPGVYIVRVGGKENKTAIRKVLVK